MILQVAISKALKIRTPHLVGVILHSSSFVGLQKATEIHSEARLLLLLKINMFEPQIGGLEDGSPFKLDDF